MNGFWDCHAHIFGPYDRFPLAADRSYTPPEAPVGLYLDMLRGLGLSNGVLVHPSAYGDDFSLLLEALNSNKNLRGVVVTRDATLQTLRDLRDSGVRAARFSCRSGSGTNFAGSASFEDLVALAPRLADAGLHAELWTDCQVLPSIADRLRGMPIAVVIDHMGGFNASAGVAELGFQSLLSLIEDGVAWVKLSAYRNLLEAADFEVGLPFHLALLGANPDALLWGTDWPHLRVKPSLDTASLLSMFLRWTPDPKLVDKILVSNPRRLYW